MRVLIVHNYYSTKLPSGENRVVEREVTMLRDAGHTVQVFGRHNDELTDSPLHTAYEFFFAQGQNQSTARRLEVTIRSFRPDVVHVHNTFPLISAQVLHLVRRMSMALVWSAHNYRPWCISADLKYRGAPCTLCPDGKSEWPGLIRGCYRGSRILTLPVAWANARHRALRSFETCPTLVIAFSSFHANRLRALGVPAEKIEVCPHFVSTPKKLIPFEHRPMRICVASRLEAAKGIFLLLDAFCRSELAGTYELVVIGDGPARENALSFCERQKLRNIRFLGTLAEQDCLDQIAMSRLVIIPSMLEETFGLNVIEAFAHGVPVLASNQAGFSELVTPETGGLFQVGDASDLARVLDRLLSDQKALAQASRRAIQLHAQSYSESAGERNLVDVFSRAANLIGSGTTQLRK